MVLNGARPAVAKISFPTKEIHFEMSHTVQEEFQNKHVYGAGQRIRGFGIYRSHEDRT